MWRIFTQEKRKIPLNMYPLTLSWPVKFQIKNEEIYVLGTQVYAAPFIEKKKKKKVQCKIF